MSEAVESEYHKLSALSMRAAIERLEEAVRKLEARVESLERVAAKNALVR
jgi:exonuclease VII small subunit